MIRAESVLLLRADADSRMGTGHVMRSLALAQAWQDGGGTALLATSNLSEALCRRLQSENVTLLPLQSRSGSSEDAEETIRLAGLYRAAWLALDGYHFPSTYRKTLQQGGIPLLKLDDFGGESEYHSDLILNQNLYASESMYAQRECNSRLLLGARYAILRREFTPHRDWKREIADRASRVLVTLGGADPDNITAMVIRALIEADVPNLEAVVLVGANNPHLDSLRRIVDSSKNDIRLRTNVSNMPDLMAWADVAVAAGGTTCWELAFMGLPALVLILADNQVAVAQSLAQSEVGINLGWAHWTDSGKIASTLRSLCADQVQRTSYSRNGRSLVDGYGGERVVKHLQWYSLRLRPVVEQDCECIGLWSNDPDVRAVSFSSEPIRWEDHVRWFRAKLQDENCRFFIATNGTQEPIGQIRFQMKGVEATVSVILANQLRGRGYGWKLIWIASQEMFDRTPIDCIHAYIKPGNDASVRAFAKAGYRAVESTTICGQPAAHFILRKLER